MSTFYSLNIVFMERVASICKILKLLHKIFIGLSVNFIFNNEIATKSRSLILLRLIVVYTVITIIRLKDNLHQYLSVLFNLLRNFSKLSKIDFSTYSISKVSCRCFHYTGIFFIVHIL